MHKNQATLNMPNSKHTLIYAKPPHLKIVNSIARSLTTKPTHFLELSIFKQQLKNSIPKAFTYNQYSSKVRYYRSIFFSLAMLFVCLGAIIFFQNLIFTNMFFGDVREIVKNSICALNAGLAIFAAGVGYSLCIAKEATEYLACKAKRKLMQLYARKRIEHGIQSFLSLPGRNDKGRLLKVAYYEMLDKIQEKKLETAELLQEIRSTAGFDTADHKLLFSQALAELDVQLKACLETFNATLWVPRTSD